MRGHGVHALLGGQIQNVNEVPIGGQSVRMIRRIRQALDLIVFRPQANFDPARR